MSDPFQHSSAALLDRRYRQTVAAALRSGVRPADPLSTSLAQARHDAESWHAFWRKGVPTVRRVVEHAVPGPVGSIPLRFFYPNGRRDQPLAVYFHGGGFVLNGITTHERLMRELAVRAEVIVCGVDYSLAPEHRFPVQVDEALASVRWIIAHAAELGTRRDRIALCGDSAGANLALSTACSLRDGCVPIQLLLLLYGMFAPDFDTPSQGAFGDGSFGLSTARMRWFWRQYLAQACARLDPRAAPLFADLRGLPPTLVIAAGLDCLRDDSVRLAHRLETAGVPNVLSVYEGLPHGFAIMASEVPRAAVAVAEAAQALARMLQRDPFTDARRASIRRHLQAGSARRIHADRPHVHHLA